MAERIIMLLAVALACCYGIVQLRSGFKNKYFIVALCAMAALLFSRIYYLVLVLSDGNDEILTVGVLGQASAYLFFMTANVRFLSDDFLEKEKKKLCIPGLAGGLLLAALFMIAAIKIGTLGAYIGEVIYIISMCGAFYCSANTFSYHKKDSSCEATSLFNLCVCMLALINAFAEFGKALASETTDAMITLVLTVLCSVIILIMLPLLRKGMRKWPQ